MEKRFSKANAAQKEVRVVTLIPSKADFKPKLVRRDEEGHFIVIKGFTRRI
jgi:hypothetical protein